MKNQQDSAWHVVHGELTERKLEKRRDFTARTVTWDCAFCVLRFTTREVLINLTKKVRVKHVFFLFFFFFFFFRKEEKEFLVAIRRNPEHRNSVSRG